MFGRGGGKEAQLSLTIFVVMIRFVTISVVKTIELFFIS